MTDTMGRMHSDAQFAGSSSVPAHVEMMGFLGIGNNPMVGCTVACAVDMLLRHSASKDTLHTLISPCNLDDYGDFSYAVVSGICSGWTMAARLISGDFQ